MCMLHLSPMVRDTPLLDFMPLPRAVLSLEITSTAKLLYALLLDRATLSQKTGYENKQGYTYVIYPVRELGAALGRSEETVRRALNELEAMGLVDRLRGHMGYNQFYLSVPDPEGGWLREPASLPTKTGDAPHGNGGSLPTKKRAGPHKRVGTITN